MICFFSVRDNIYLSIFPVLIFENTGSYVAYKFSRFRAWNVIERPSTARFQISPLKHCTKATEGTSKFYQGQNKRFLVNAAAGQPLDSEPGAYTEKSVWNSAKDALDAFYRFSRPHTVIGTVSLLDMRASPIQLFVLISFRLQFNNTVIFSDSFLRGSLDFFL